MVVVIVTMSAAIAQRYGTDGYGPNQCSGGGRIRLILLPPGIIDLHAGHILTVFVIRNVAAAVSLIERSHLGLIGRSAGGE